MWRVLVLACCVCAKRQLARPRVYLGQEDTNKEFPFVVSMQRRDGSRICTCSLIAENWVITAGHNVKRTSTNKIIKYADFTLNETKAYSEIIKTFRHPGYFFSITTELSALNDLALLLIEKVPSKMFAKLSAIDYRALLGLPVKYAAFGRTMDNELSKTVIVGDDLRALQVGEGVVTTCTPVYPMFGPAICVAPKCSNKFQNTRKGDAGGPLVYMGKIVGVIIGSEHHVPIAYVAPVSPNLEWIYDTINKFS